jgi:hypothetical protein
VEKEVRKELMLGFQNLVLVVGVYGRQLGGTEMPNWIKARLNRP